MNQPAYPAHFLPPPPGALTIGQVLDRTYMLIRTNLRLLAGLAVVPSAAFFLIFGVVLAVFFVPILSQLPHQPDPENLARLFNPGAFIPLIIIITVVNGAVFSLYLAAASHAVTQADCGVKVTIRESYTVAWNRAGEYLLLLLLLYACTFLPALLIELLMFSGIGNAVSNQAAANPALIALIPLGMLLYFAAFVFAILVALRLSLAFPVCVVEQLPAWPALKRSSQLTKGAKGRIFLILLVIYAFSYLFTLVLFAILGALGGLGCLLALALGIHLASPLGYAALTLFGICALLGLLLYMALSWAGYTTALAVLYRDQRLRKDGLLPASAPSGDAA